ncbi:CpsB/CapC family capsule biosynthesis tyrosine phosphatase [uncultured Flavobacterium sp.]|uniref:tyrosine-protein phosphatase n=1 Tax=uncultured Flavobacterium sp. TaxID=165435 RepID=UPI0030EB43AD
MFSFLKPKARLLDLIPTNYVDIHSHVLPGIDDGAKTIEDSKFLLESMIEFGFTKVITSPHTIENIWNNTPETISNALKFTKENLSALTEKVALKAASEYIMDDYFASLFDEGKLLTIKDNYVLVEMSYINPPIQLYDYIFKLQVAGYIPILAHPERYVFYHSDFSNYAKLKKAGCYFQMNLLSATGYYGKEVAKIADQLLKNDMIDFVGSDFHHKHHVASFSNPIIIKEVDRLKKAAENNCSFK